MPTELGIWKVNGKPERVHFSKMPAEDKLEDILDQDLSILNPGLLLIGRQVPTAYGKFIDLLALDSDGKVVVIELKRDRTPRDVVAQVLDYGSWVRELEDENIASIFRSYLAKYRPERAEVSLDQAFCEHFGVDEMPEQLNAEHELIVVASELDASTERIVAYLSDEYGVAINVVFFRFFREGANEFLCRVWLIDPTEAEAKSVSRHREGKWNDEFYVSFGEGPLRRWEDARRLGYVAAGGGAWYSKTLDQLVPGARIWVNVPGKGYVGVGIVRGKPEPITTFKVRDPDSPNRAPQPIKALAPSTPPADKPEDELEYFVPVEWLHTVPLHEAAKEKGFFGNQNTVAKPTAEKWAHTVERLKIRFGVHG